MNGFKSGQGTLQGISYSLRLAILQFASAGDQTTDPWNARPVLYPLCHAMGGLNATESFSSLVLILNLLIDVYTKQFLRMQLFDAGPNSQYIQHQ